MGDQEHCKAKSHQSADRNQPEGAFTAGGGQHNALAVVNNGVGQVVADLVVNAIGLLNISNIAILVSKDDKGTDILTCLELNGLRQGVIACRCLDLLQVVGAFLQAQDSQLTVFLRNNQVVLVNLVAMLVLKVFLQISFIQLTGGLLHNTADIFGGGAIAIENIHTADVGGDHKDGLLAVCIFVNAELSACQVLTGSKVVLQQTDAVNIGHNLFGLGGNGLMLAGPGSVSLVVAVAMGSVANSSGGFYNRSVDDLYGNGRIKLESGILGEVYRIGGGAVVSVGNIADGMALKPGNGDTELVVVQVYQVPLCVITGLFNIAPCLYYNI